MSSMKQSASLLRRTALAASAVLLSAPTVAADATPRESQTEKTRDGKAIHLTMYRKHLGGGKLPVLFLVHGSSGAALSGFEREIRFSSQEPKILRG